MGCNGEITNICSDTITTTCVDHEGVLGTNTKIIQACVNQSMVNTDLYAITDETIDNMDTSQLGDLCIPYTVTDGKILPKSVWIQNETEICNIKNRLAALEVKDFSKLDITSFGLNFNCLVDPCGSPITELGQLLQIIINKTCP